MKTPELPKLSLSQAFSTKRSATAQKSNAMSNTTNQTSKTERSRVSKFIKNISDFFKTLFKQPSSTNAPSMPNMTNIPISIVSVSTPAVDKALESKQAIISTLQTVFETPSLASNTEIKSFKSEFEAQDFSELTLKESQLFMDKVQQVVAKDSEDKQAIISTLQTVFETPAFASNTEIKSLKSAFEAKDFSELTLKETQLFMSTVKQVVVKQAKLTVETSKQSIQSLIIHFVKSTHSKFQESIAPIQKTVMKRIRTIQATRDLESKFFKDTTGSQVSTEKGKENYQKLLNLYTEKHLKTTFTTIMGTQYSHLNADTKDVQLGGRQSSQIDADIEDLLLNNPKLKAQYDKQIGGLFTGLSSILKKETETLIKTTLANDQTMANIKALQVSIIAIQETTEGLDQANSQCGGSDDTALNQTFHSAKELMTISTNFSHFCQNFIEGFHSKTHIDKTSIKSIVQAIADSDQKFQAIPASKKDAYITALTEHLNHRLEHKKVIQKTSQSMGSIDTSKLATFKLKSAKPSTQKTWHKLFSQKNKFLITKSKGEHMELFNKISAKLEAKIKIHTDLIGKKDIKKMIQESLSEMSVNSSHQEAFTQYVTDYVIDRLEHKNTLSTHDAGAILTPNKTVKIASKKPEFTQSPLQTEPTFKEALHSMTPQLNMQMKASIQTAYNSRGLKSKVEKMTQQLQSNKISKQASSLRTTFNLNNQRILNYIRTKSYSSKDAKKEEKPELSALAEKLSPFATLSDSITALLNGDSFDYSKLASLSKDADAILDALDSVKHLAQDNAERLNHLIETVPLAGTLLSAANIIKHIANAANKEDEVKTLREMVAHVQSEDLTTLFDKQSPRVETFAKLLTSKDDRDKSLAQAVYSSINLASAPLGICVGSLLNEVVDTFSEGHLNIEDYHQIAENIVTLNTQYSQLATKTQKEATHTFIDCLRQESLVGDEDAVNDAFVDYATAGVDPQKVAAEISHMSF